MKFKKLLNCGRFPTEIGEVLRSLSTLLQDTACSPFIKGSTESSPHHLSKTPPALQHWL